MPLGSAMLPSRHHPSTLTRSNSHRLPFLFLLPHRWECPHSLIPHQAGTRHNCTHGAGQGHLHQCVEDRFSCVPCQPINAADTSGLWALKRSASVWDEDVRGGSVLVPFSQSRVPRWLQWGIHIIMAILSHKLAGMSVLEAGYHSEQYLPQSCSPLRSHHCRVTISKLRTGFI